MDLNIYKEESVKAYKEWQALSPIERSRLIFSIGNEIKSQASKFVASEEKYGIHSARECQDFIIPLLIRSSDFFAGIVTSMEEELEFWEPYGVVAFKAEEDMSLICLVQSVFRALSAGNAVLIATSNSDSSASVIAEICADAGLPKNVVCASTDPVPDEIKDFKLNNFFKDELRILATNDSPKSNPMIIFDSADLDSSIQCLIDDLKFGKGRTPWSISRVLVQESIYGKFITKMKFKMKNVPLASDNPSKELVEEFERSGGQVFRVFEDECSPALLLDVPPVSKCFQRPLLGPIVAAMSFRTPKEAVALANNANKPLNASIFTEKICLALEVAESLNVGTVWINSHRVLDPYSKTQELQLHPACWTDGVYNYAFSRGISRDSLQEVYGITNRLRCGGIADMFESETKKDVKTLFYDGELKAAIDYGTISFGGFSNSVAQTPDINKAVESAVKAQLNWSRKSRLDRSKVLFNLSYLIQQQGQKFIDDIKKCNSSSTNADEDVDEAASLFAYWANQCLSPSGDAYEIPPHYSVMKKREAVGVVGLLVSYEYPLLAFAALVAPALASGNTVVCWVCSSPILELLSILLKSGLPAGVVNILTGDVSYIIEDLSEHLDVNSIWLPSYYLSSVGLKRANGEARHRTWIYCDYLENLTNIIQFKEELLLHSTRTKAIWMTRGESFAN